MGVTLFDGVGKTVALTPTGLDLLEHARAMGIATNALSDLQRREAEIAIRHVKPEQPDLIARLIREATACFYVSENWVRIHGHPRRAEDATHLPFVGSDRMGQSLSYLRQHGLPVTEVNFSCYADHSVAHWSLVH